MVETLPNRHPPKLSWKEKAGAVFIIAGLLAGGTAIAQYLNNTRPAAKKKTQKERVVTAVRVLPAGIIDTYAKVAAIGVVIPAKEITIQPQVSGTVTYIHKQFIPGGILNKGETIITIDDRDYRFELIHRQAELTKAIAEFNLEQGKQRVAKEEWNMIQGGSSISADSKKSSLALRKPQLAETQAAVNSAKASVERALLNIERTRITAPFNAIVHEKQVDVGSQVSPQSAIASLVGIDAYWVKVSLPASHIPMIKLPKGDKAGSDVIIISDFNTANEIRYKGKILTVMGNVEPDGLMARIIVEVADPLGLYSDRQPLLLGSSVRVEIHGKPIKDVSPVPRAAVHDNDTVFIAGKDDNLDIRKLTILWKDRETVYVRGIKEHERIIITSVPVPVEGMPLVISEK